MTTYGYGRVSREEQTTENQKQLVELKRKIPVDVWFEDHGVSGKVKAMKRKEFSAMRSLAVKGDTIVFSRVDRIGRLASDILTVVEDILADGIEVYILQVGDLPLSGQQGKLMLGFLALFAESERDAIVERTLDGLARSRRSGTIFGRPLAIDPQTLTILCNRRAEGSTLKTISEEYNLDAMTVQRNIKKWNGKMQEYYELYNKQQKQIETNLLKDKNQ